MIDTTQHGYTYSVTMPIPNWLRGKEACEDARLYHPEKKKYDICGFLLFSYGWDTRYLREFRFPASLVQKYMTQRRAHLEEPLEWMVNTAKADSEDTLALLAINDDLNTEDETKAEHIARILGHHNIGIKFSEQEFPATLREVRADSVRGPSILSSENWRGLTYDQVTNDLSTAYHQGLITPRIYLQTLNAARDYFRSMGQVT